MGGYSCIILAGGRGTRLSNAVSDVPKPMARIGNVPFLEFMLQHLSQQGFTKAVLSVGFKRAIIMEHFGNKYRQMEIQYAEETEPLGTGGAIRRALGRVSSFPTFVLNGDSFIDLEYEGMIERHSEKKSEITIAVKSVADVGRSGCVEVDETEEVTRFRESSSGTGLINTGVYLVSREFLNYLPNTEQAFSFEETLRDSTSNIPVSAFVTSGYFIDIGVPADYERAQHELPGRISTHRDNSSSSIA